MVNERLYLLYYEHTKSGNTRSWSRRTTTRDCESGAYARSTGILSDDSSPRPANLSQFATRAGRARSMFHAYAHHTAITATAPTTQRIPRHYTGCQGQTQRREAVVLPHLSPKPSAHSMSVLYGVGAIGAIVMVRWAAAVRRTVGVVRPGPGRQAGLLRVSGAWHRQAGGGW